MGLYGQHLEDATQNYRYLTPFQSWKSECAIASSADAPIAVQRFTIVCSTTCNAASLAVTASQLHSNSKSPARHIRRASDPRIQTAGEIPNCCQLVAQLQDTVR